MTEKNIADIPIKGRKCPVCKKDSVRRFQPFCSKHCADVDLGRWLTESYVIEGKEDKKDILQKQEDFNELDIDD